MTKPSRVSGLNLRALGLLALVGLGCAAGWDLWRHRARVAQETRQRRACAAELRQLGGRLNEGNLPADIARAGESLASARVASGLFAEKSPEPPAPALAYFELAQHLGRWREQVRAAGLGVKADERFGFPAQAENRGEAGQRVRLRRQIRAMDRMVAALAEAHPQQVLSWQFVEPNTDVVAPCVAGELIGAETVRVAFVGGTASLRSVLNSLAQGVPAWVVHSVDARRKDAHPAVSGSLAPRGEDVASSLVLRAEPEPPMADTATSGRVFAAGPMRFEITASAVEWVGPARATVPAGVPGVAPWSAENGNEAKAFPLFTPPTLWFDEAAGCWSAHADREPAAAPAELALKVLTVEPELFRLQLGGFIGGAPDGRGVFTNLETGATFLARAGAELPELGIRILQVARNAERAETTARVLDERSGGALELSDLRNLETGAAVAEVEVPGGRRRVREGDALACAGVLYRIRAINLASGSVEVEAESPMWSAPVVQTLQRTAPLTFTP